VLGFAYYRFEFDVHVTVHRDKFRIIKPTRRTNFSISFWNETKCFGQFLCPSSGVFHCTHSNGIRHTGLRAGCKQDQDGTAETYRFEVTVSRLDGAGILGLLLYLHVYDFWPNFLS
jgi:hypothetical protein